MIEVLFRAWDGKKFSYSKREDFDDSVNFRFDHFDGFLESPILELFVGLLDYKGNKIFEGDILQHPSGEKFLVIYDKSRCQFRADYNTGLTSDIGLQVCEKGQAVVIGNIHEALTQYEIQP